MPAMKLKKITTLWPPATASSTCSQSSGIFGEAMEPSLRLSGTEAMRRSSESAWNIIICDFSRPCVLMLACMVS